MFELALSGDLPNAACIISLHIPGAGGREGGERDSGAKKWKRRRRLSFTSATAKNLFRKAFCHSGAQTAVCPKHPQAARRGVRWSTGARKRKQPAAGETEFSVTGDYRGQRSNSGPAPGPAACPRYALEVSLHGHGHGHGPGRDWPRGAGGSKGEGRSGSTSSSRTRSLSAPSLLARCPATPERQPPSRRCARSPPRPGAPHAAAPRARSRRHLSPPRRPGGPEGRRCPGGGGRRCLLGRTGRAGEFIPLEGNSFCR